MKRPKIEIREGIGHQYFLYVDGGFSAEIDIKGAKAIKAQQQEIERLKKELEETKAFYLGKRTTKNSKP